MNDVWIAIILGIVEGVTEFLPISSTGHLILVNKFLGFEGSFEKTFDVVIQLGAILSVVVYFWQRLVPWGRSQVGEQQRLVFDTWKRTMVGVIPALLIGGILGKIIQKWLFNVTTVSIALIIGGGLILIIESRKRASPIDAIAKMSYQTAFFIGLFQCLAMIPGTSRSAATIIGAMLLGCTRLVAAEFSFFLAIPTMLAASGYTLLKAGLTLTAPQLMLLGLGFLVSFLVAWLVIAIFIRFISRNNFKPFGYYRIGLGLALLFYFFGF